MTKLSAWRLSDGLLLECETMDSLLRLRVLRRTGHGTRVLFSTGLALEPSLLWDTGASEPTYWPQKTVQPSARQVGDLLVKHRGAAGRSRQGRA
jgi:hypothetical protein